MITIPITIVTPQFRNRRRAGHMSFLLVQSARFSGEALGRNYQQRHYRPNRYRILA